MNEDYDTIRKTRIDMAAQILQAVVIHNLEPPRGTSIINEHQQLVMYVDTDAGLQGWREYIGFDRYGSLLPWPWDHDWYVLVVSLQAEDSGAGGIEPSSPPPVSVDVLADGAAMASALLDPDAELTVPCQQTTAHEPHGKHVRHVGVYTRSCFGWADEPTVQLAAVSGA